MALYTGSILKKFIVDRLALGIPFPKIKSDFMSAYGETAWTDDILKTLGITDDDVRERESELLNEYSLDSFLDNIKETSQMLKDSLQEMRDQNNTKGVAIIAPQYMKSLELIEKMMSKYEQRQERKAEESEMARRNYRAIQLLADENVITINDDGKLKLLLGI